MTDAPAVAVAPGDAGVGRPKKKQRRATGGTSASTDLQGTPEEYEESEPEPPPLTAAERRLEWRGDDVTLPASRVDMAGGGEARALEDTEINATINSQAGGVRDCVIQGATGTDLRATITVKLVVDRAGKVSKSKLHAPRYLFDKGLLHCAQRSLRSMKFPATGAPTLVTLPISLG
ncbi:MAG: hypothetical protein M3680_30800 [Myxococcota bacterium]|nr:hypothetical protein [Myxococcota bacterium]